ncbi:ATP-dependent Clp protease ATP-binding subunit ClpC [Candidatus Gracilibacteria bacterium CG_4_9_14_0_2_um_filter_38_7]|nr:MAG: ATP-dependent Clp protease ATP-binding subunit ClpC [Candidatus Gracilibacteria bacterium CG_4_9_14_0_2_um_filter_38_7]
MYTNFTEEYKNLMLETENIIKSKGFSDILPEDVFLHSLELKTGPIYELYANSGVNMKIANEVLSRPPFNLFSSERAGAYTGLSSRLKELIVLSMKIAAGAEKKKAGIEDFLLALFRANTETWFYQFFDFIGLSPKDIEQDLKNININIVKNGDSAIFGPLDNILHAIEEGLAGGFNEGEMTDPFAGNKKPEGKKTDSLTPALDFFGTDLTEEALEGKIDVIIGRDMEIERLISVLNRKTKNNPCLVGEPGVGKTAVIEGLALRIAQGKVPLAMQNKRIVSLDLSGMVAGTKYRGEFEARLKQIIEEASKMENEVVLFIDEIHTIIGAGSAEGTLDAANILKPAMGRGKVCIIGATTLSEYQKYIEKDSALERRFQKIDVDEPKEEVAVEIISGLRSSFEEFHNLIIDDNAITDAVRLSVRYITDRYLPDKAIDLVDEACSAKSMKYNSDENDVKVLKQEIEKLQKEVENFVISGQFHKAIKIKEKQNDIEKKIQAKKAKKVIPRAKRLHITADDIQKIIERITGVPAKNIKTEDMKKLQSLEKNLSRHIIGQDEAISSIVSAIKRNRAGISNKNRPIGSFLFLGPTGVGKTELVKQLALEFFGDEKALIKLDMSEYNEKSSASKLIGTTAGYVGYEEGGMLTERVRRKPYSIVLFDEIEKGSFEVFNLLLQILEDGTLTDGKGRKINFKNTIVIMTSNIGGEEFNSKASQIGFDVSSDTEAKIIRDYEKIKEKITGGLDEYFSPEFLNRIDRVVVFNPLDKSILKKIIVLQLEILSKRLADLDIALKYDTKAISLILKETYNPEFGARPVRRFIQDKIEDMIADRIIQGKKSSIVTITALKGKLIVK